MHLYGTGDPGVRGRVRVTDGRQLTVERLSDPHGRPIFLLHGTPGSGLGPAPRGMVLCQRSMQLIVVRTGEQGGRVLVPADLPQVACQVLGGGEGVGVLGSEHLGAPVVNVLVHLPGSGVLPAIRRFSARLLAAARVLGWDSSKTVVM
jgi:hypothetical protein